MIMFLYGEDTYRLRERLKQLKKAFAEKYDRSHMVTLEGRGLTVNDFHNAVSSLGLFSEKRFIVVDGLLRQQKSKKILDDFTMYLTQKTLPEDSVVVFVEDCEPAEKPHALWKVLLAGKHVTHFAPLSPPAVHDWALHQVKELGCTIEPDALRYVVMCTGNDLWALHQEIHKLCLGSTASVITMAQVRGSVRSPFDENIFHFIDALSQRNVSLSLRLLEDQFAVGAETPMLLGHLSRQFRLLAHLHSLPENMKETDVQKCVGVHPYVLRKTRAFTKVFSAGDLQRIFTNLVEVDRRLKTTSIDPKAALVAFVASVCNKN